MTREVFKNLMMGVTDFYNQCDRFNEALEQFNSSYCMFGYDTPLPAIVIKAISDELNDTDDYISWWLFEDVEKIVYDGDEAIDLSTLDKLYDFLCKNRFS